ncbi:MAG: streptogramin lyase [Flavobacteriaceae bacterium]|jgi:streptogramin lyase|uniref:type IX secretion system anionic LPS delivery protein PorZ n=1 Tax=Candidatus Marifrigoribacter sp. Uisw_064 TaxID=3230970 RepID=UPI003AE2C814
MKQLGTLFILLLSQFIVAQNFETTWTGYFSYVSVKSISQGNDKIYVASENAVFTYDLSTQELSTISAINGLSGEAISTIHYSDDTGLLIIGYENGLIEIVIDGEEEVLQVVDILDKQTIPPNQKRINHFNEYQGRIYIATKFGISVYDLENLEFGDTYFIGNLGAQINISQTTVFGDYIYAATTENGIRGALVNDDNIIDYQAWNLYESGSFNGIQILGSELYVARNDNKVFEFIPGSGINQVLSFSTSIVDFIVKNDLLTITTPNAIQAYSDGFTLEALVTSVPDIDYTLQAGISYNNNFYMGTTEHGVLAVPFGSQQSTQLLPDGPINNHPFSIDASPGQLWVNFGDVTVFFNPYPLTRIGISHLKDDEWSNYSYDDIKESLGVDDVNDLVYTTINPENPNEVYMSSFQKGLMKIVDNEPSILFDETNSPLIVPFDNDALGLRIFGSDFDKDGNLWFVQSRSEEGLVKLTPNGQFQMFDTSSIIVPQDLSEVKVSREGTVFFGALEEGLVGYNPTSNLFNVISSGVGNGNLPTKNVRALAFDNQNRLWIGTLSGLRVLFNVGGFFNEGNEIESQAIIILENGVAQELLFQQSVTDIEVDGSNNKWVATATSGVFYLSSNGQETIHRFTTENSPLPSDNVQDIAIDDLSGVVYFATADGLVAFNGTSTAPREDLEEVYSFPNPVRPGFDGNVTIDGLTANANVKITDITGSLVFETTSEGGSVLWDTTAFGKYKVASGVYLILVTTSDALETKVAKLMIIR